MSKKKTSYPLCIEEWAEQGFYTFGFHDREEFILGISHYLDEEVESIEGFVQEYGYNVPAAHYSDYSTMWYPCDGPKRGARPITQCYDVRLKPREATK